MCDFDSQVLHLEWHTEQMKSVKESGNGSYAFTAYSRLSIVSN